MIQCSWIGELDESNNHTHTRVGTHVMTKGPDGKCFKSFLGECYSPSHEAHQMNKNLALFKNPSVEANNILRRQYE